ncbi:CopD family protein [Pseudofrankia inefficax]|uniref:Copper resistance D domain protein n=1 Tax=Pseudofrankia inefficax (strain DSM 45817 / CECT 9037 / DDB 130130 / EuI1c) TaxID=298654 RepID=E3JCT1_PSEI1|nr:CopD family protein [Pseudofrankia inefficax]ADP79921.1 copper resistance D domain protein [Pseudofrankia inefficax]
MQLTTVVAAPPPSTPLGPFADSAVAWTTWITLMGFVGLTALALLATGPAARRIGPDAVARVTARLASAAVPLGVLAVPAVLSDLAHDASESGGFDYAAAWDSLYDGSNAGRLSGLEVTLSLVGAVAVAPLVLRRVAGGRARVWLLAVGLLAGAVALGTTKFPAEVPGDWSRTSFETVMWMLHLLGGAVWAGGLAGLLLLALPGGVQAGERGAFWSAAIRRFSAVAMSCVAAIALSGLFLYWEHVDGPSQLFTTMYGRVLGVKILIFGTLLVLGVVNQFWLHPRVEALRAAGDERPLRTILTRQFPAVVAVELLLVLTVLFVAPFLHGSARNQAFQAKAAQQAATADAKLPKIAAKEVSASTWVWGTGETVLVIGVMAAGYQVSGRLARARTPAVATTPPGAGGPGGLVGA